MVVKTKAALMAFAVALALAGTALAHDPPNRQAYQVQQYGYDNGYRDGFNHGVADRSNRASYDYRDASFQQADRGYAGWMGPRGQFRQGYRDGYRVGYDDAYFGRSAQITRTYDEGVVTVRPPGSGDAAFANGYRDGLVAGRDEAREGKSFSPYNNGWYRNADRGYYGDYGSRDTYKHMYRQGYLEGYQQAYWNH
ncbi:MAG TPA: hypothetical protein VLE48_12100 [Terriglobales bacterium]|nr:hypothetical protein [Terriglobales bacterium]